MKTNQGVSEEWIEKIEYLAGIHGDREELKSFIRSLLESQKTEFKQIAENYAKTQCELANTIQRSELLKEIKEEIEKASEQIQGGGNGRRILIQLSEEITKKIK